MDAFLRFGQARLCPPTLGQYACTALDRDPGRLHPGVDRRVRAAARRRASPRSPRFPASCCRKPEGRSTCARASPWTTPNGFAEFLLRDFDLDGETVDDRPGRRLLRDAGPGRDEVRIAYVLEEAKLRRAMTILAAALAALPGRRSR